MEQSQYNKLFSFIWNIATDVLVYAFERGEYKKIILPMMVLRRIDVLLEPTKKELLERKKWLDDNDFTNNQDPILCEVTGLPFYNTSLFTMKTLKSETDPLRLKLNFTDYLNGFSEDVRDIIDKFHLRQMVDNLTEAERLGSIIEKFTDDSINLSNRPVLNEDGTVKLPALDNHTMGTIFEELLRKFNEENNVTEAGEHFTPRDYVKLLADIAVMPIADRITDTTYKIYDGACGTGGILTIAQDRIREIAAGKRVVINIYGQELQPETFATCKADLMISGDIQSFHYLKGSEMRDFIAFDSTISRDGHAGETYDFCISNPPFGTPWKEDLKKRGLGENDKKKFSDSRFSVEYKGREFSFIPDIGDCQMMFLANNLSRMRDDTPLGTRIVEVHNGSSLFTGDAGSGASNLRQFIIENDLLEAIIAMPEKDFYNTGIGTFIWVVTNRKEERRKGFVQLIDATEIKTPLRKNLGEKNCETSEDDRRAILQLLMDFKETPQSKIFPNNEFGYWSVKVERPLRESITLNPEVLQRAVYSLERHDVEFTEECKKTLMENGIFFSLPDDTPIIKEGTSVFDEQYAKFRKLKFPKTVGQLQADIALSQALLVICEMMEERELWLDRQEFEIHFNEIAGCLGFKLKYSKIETVLPVFAERNPDAMPVLKNGKPVADPKLRDSEIIPFRYDGGIEGFLHREILPYTPDAWIDETSILEGYELSFTKYFYKPKQLRTIEEISTDIRGIEKRTNGMLDEILGK